MTVKRKRTKKVITNKAQQSPNELSEKQLKTLVFIKTVVKGKRKKKVVTWRSGLEESVSKRLKDLKIPFEYETMKIEYSIPESKHKYTPDFILENFIVETKGIFTKADRNKHLYVREHHPELDIRFVFTNSKAKLYKGSKTTYADWCVKNNFKYADKLIPDDWLKE